MLLKKAKMSFSYLLCVLVFLSIDLNLTAAQVSFSGALSYLLNGGNTARIFYPQLSYNQKPATSTWDEIWFPQQQITYKKPSPPKKKKIYVSNQTTPKQKTKVQQTQTQSDQSHSLNTHSNKEYTNIQSNNPYLSNGQQQIKEPYTSKPSTNGYVSKPHTGNIYFKNPSQYPDSNFVQNKPKEVEYTRFNYYESNACITPENERGNCINVYSCPGLLKLVGREDKSRLKLFKCGWEGKTVKVCCTPKNAQRLLPGYEECGTFFSERIVGGKIANLDEYPWNALLYYTSPKGYKNDCGGTLISKRYVLTAAHCVNNLPTSWKLTDVHLGEWNTSSRIDCVDGICAPPVQVLAIEEIIPHAMFDKNTDYNDIALLRLDRDAVFSDYVRPVCLPFDKTLLRETFQNYTGVVTGWGRTETGRVSDVKLKLDIPIVSNRDCNEKYTQLGRTIKSSMICAGGRTGEDTCRGDSGGPLIIGTNHGKNWVQIGITSFGPENCGFTDWASVYTRVTSFMDWIESRLKP